MGLDTLGNELERDALAREPRTVAVVWVTGVLKLVGAALAIAIARQALVESPSRPLRWAVWAVGLGITAYAAANFIQHGLMASGAVEVPDALGDDAVTWHLALWDPFWLLGGVLFLAAAMTLRR